MSLWPFEAATLRRIAERRATRFEVGHLHRFWRLQRRNATYANAGVRALTRAATGIAFQMQYGPLRAVDALRKAGTL